MQLPVGGTAKGLLESASAMQKVPFMHYQTGGLAAQIEDIMRCQMLSGADASLLWSLPSSCGIRGCASSAAVSHLIFDLQHKHMHPQLQDAYRMLQMNSPRHCSRAPSRAGLHSSHFAKLHCSKRTTMDLCCHTSGRI